MLSKPMRRSATADALSKKRFCMDQFKEFRCFDENPRDESWNRHERHFFIITDASRPVYCRYGNEINVTPILCTIVAFTGQLVRDGNQKLKTIVAGNKHFVFYLPLPFIFVCVSSVRLPESLIMKELQALELLIFSILSKNITATLQKRPNFDIKKQTSGSEGYFTATLEYMDQSHTFIFHESIPMAAISSCRDKYEQIVFQNYTKNIYACIVFYQGEVFFVVENQNFHISSDDILILLNNAFPSGESLDSNLIPLCLPNRDDMYHIMTAEIKENLDFTVVIITDQIDLSIAATRMLDNIITQFKESKLERPETIEPIENNDILHFIVTNHNLKQVYSPFVISNDLSKVLYRSYAWAYEYLKSSNISGPFYLATDELTMFGHHMRDSTVIAATHVGYPAQKTQALYKELKKYIEENQKTFFDYSPMKWTD